MSIFGRIVLRTQEIKSYWINMPVSQALQDIERHKTSYRQILETCQVQTPSELMNIISDSDRTNVLFEIYDRKAMLDIFTTNEVVYFLCEMK